MTGVKVRFGHLGTQRTGVAVECGGKKYLDICHIIICFMSTSTFFIMRRLESTDLCHYSTLH